MPNTRVVVPPEVRFMAFVSLPDDGEGDSVTAGCWLWTGYRCRDGYGRFYWPHPPRRGTSILAHRAAFELFRGDFDQALLVRHKCDNPRCVNPEHLELGTYSDNLHDAYDRGSR